MLSFKKIFYTLKPKQYLSVVLSFSLLMLPIQLQALPAGQRVMAGSASFAKTLNNLKITTSNKAIINYNSFNIGTKEGVLFVQPSINSVVLNRVIQANPSSILGSLNANGNVFLVNPAGIFFGANSIVNANSFLATTLNISDDNFLNGNYQFQQMKDIAQSYIVQKGSISVSPQGFVVLASPFVSSEGSIMAKAGHINIGATDNFYIQFDSGGLIRYDYQKNVTDDKPIVIPKAYADSIINNVVNTEGIDSKLQIVHNGDKVELIGGSGTAMVSGKINTDATNNAQAGTTKVQAQNNALLLNGATVQSNALSNGNGGRIILYGENFAYGDTGASLEAKGGSLSGNGGFIDLSAKNSALLNGTYVDTSAQNGNRGTFLIDPTDLTIGSDVSMNSHYSATADNSITLDNGVSISTNGGNIDFSAPTITLKDQSKLLAGTGDVTLNAISNKSTIIDAANSQITINAATIKGNHINILSSATSTNKYYDPDGTSPAINQALTFLANSPISPAGVSITNSKSTININNGADIEGSNIKIDSQANSNSNVFTIFSGIAVGYGESTAKATTTVNSGATIISSGKLNINSHATTSNIVKAYTVSLGGSRGSKADVTLAYADSTTNAISEVKNGATITAGGDLSLKAVTDKSIGASALAGAYEDGTVGAGVAITNSTSQTTATLGGDVQAKNLTVEANTNNKLVKTASSAAVGSGIIAKGVVKGANIALDGLSKYVSFIPSGGSGDNAQPFAISAAFSYAKHNSQTQANIADSANVQTSGSLNVLATTSYPIDPKNGAKGIKSSTIATIDSNDANTKNASVAGAITYADISNTTDAFIGKGATLNSEGDIFIHSKTDMPYEITWANINSIWDVTSKLNSNLGIQDGFFTTWAQSNSQGKVVGVAGSVNIFHMNNDTNAYIDSNAKINQSASTFGKTTVLAENDLQSLNLSGVFGLKFFGSSGGTSGVGGSYLDLLYNDTAIASVKSGAKLKSSSLAVVAHNKTKNISIAEAGGTAGKYGIAGSVSNITTNDTTHASIDGADIFTTSGLDSTYNKSNLMLEATDYAKIFNVTGGITKAKNVGIGASVSLNKITRNTQAFIQNSTLNTGGPSNLIATNTGEIDAFSLAGAINAEGGPKGKKESAPEGGGDYGLGISGDASLNTISDVSLTNIKNSSLSNKKHSLAMQAKNSSTIKSFTGSVAISADPTAKSVGISGSFSKADIKNNKSESSINNSKITVGGIDMSANNDNTINTLSASGAGGPNGELNLAGSVSINNIADSTNAFIDGGSTVTSNSGITISSEDKSSINAIAGAVELGGKVGVGASFAKNSIADSTTAYTDGSDVSSEGALNILANSTSKINLYTGAVAAIGNMAAAISISINDITNTIKSWINGKKTSGISSKGDLNVKATDNATMNAYSGDLGVGSSLGVGVSVLYNVIKNTIETYISNTTVNSDGNNQIVASSNKNMKTYSVGGAGAGTASLAGSVVVNTIKDTTNSYIDNSIFHTSNSLVIEAMETNDITTWGGALSVGGTVGIGGTAIVNDIANNIQTYISGNSNVIAEGTNPLLVLTGDGSGTNESIHGLDMLALGNENIQNDAATLSLSGTVGLDGSVSTNILNDNILSHISGSVINDNSNNPNSTQDVRVRARSNNDFNLITGGVAGSGTVAAGASVDTTMLKNKTLAYISGSTVYAQNLVQTNSNEQDRFNSIVANGSGAGVVSLAGSVETFTANNINNSYIDASNIYSNHNIDILAKNDIKMGTLKDGTKRGILVGALSGAGAVGVGGSVLVTNVKQNVLAYLKNSVTNAKGMTSIQSIANANLISYITTAGLGGYEGAAGAVGVNYFDVTSQAYTSGNSAINQNNSYKNAHQNVNINANSDSTINNLSGSLGAGLVGAGASIDVSKIVNKVLASVGPGTKLYAGDALSVKAHSIKSDTSNVIAFAGGVLGVAGAVSIVNINNQLSGNAITAAGSTKSSTNSQISTNRASGKLGSNPDASEATTDINNATPTNVNSVFDQSTLPSSYTIAKIDSSVSNPTTIETIGKTSVIALDDTFLNILTGSMAGGVLGVGGSVGLGYINLNSQAYIAPYADVTADSLDVESNMATHNPTINSYAGAVGTVGLGAAVAELTLNYLDSSYIGDYSKINTNTNIDLQSKSDLSSTLNGFGATFGAAAVGVVMATLKQSGTTSASVMDNAQLTSKNHDINVLASYQGDSSTKAQAAAGGIVNGSGSISKTDVTPTVSANVGDHAMLKSAGDTQILSDAMGKVKSKSDGFNIGGISVGISKSESYWTPNITTNIGSYTDITANNFYANAYENYDTSDNLKTDKTVSATSSSAVGSLVGGTGSSAQAKSDATVGINVGDYTNITTTNDAQFRSKAYAKTTTESSGHAYALVAGGSSDATSTNDASVFTDIGQFTNINANKNISLLAYSRNEATADTTGGSGGFVNGTGADSEININNSATVSLGDNSQLNAKNGDVSMQAVGYLDTAATSSVTTAGGITINKTKSKVSITQDITTNIGKNSKIEAKNIDIQSRVDYLHASSTAYSKTIAAYSTSHAIADTTLTSNTNLHIQPSAQLIGYNSVTLKAIQGSVDVSAKSTARIDAGVTGTVIADTTNKSQLNTLVQIDKGSSISTNNLLIKAYVPPKSGKIYHLTADAKAATVVNWVLTKTRQLVKSVSKIPIIGWFVKWIWKTVYKLLKQILHSDVAPTISGDYTSPTNKIIMNGNLYQLPSSPQSINVAANGAVTSQGEIQASIGSNNININNLINHDVGKIVLDSSDEIDGAGNIYISSAYPSVAITNHTNKNLTINNINTISDNSNQPNIEFYNTAGKNYTTFKVGTKNLSHSVTIDNLGFGNIIFNGAINNYGGDTSIINSYGNILTNSGSLIQTKTLNLLAHQGNIGTPSNYVEAELQKSDSDNPYINSQSLGATYLGLKLSEFLDTKPASNHVINKAVLNNIVANGPINIALNTGNLYYGVQTTDPNTGDVTTTIKTALATTRYSIKNMTSSDNILINGQSGVSLALDGTLQSGYKDLSVNINNTDPSISSSPYLDSIASTDIYLKPIASQGGHVDVNLANGTTFDVTKGATTLLDGYMYMNINNLTNKNLNLASITNNKINGSFLYNGSPLSFKSIGYPKGEVNIKGGATGKISMLGNILSPNGTVNFTGNNGLFDPSGALASAHDIAFNFSSNDIGTSAEAIQVSGILSVNAANNIYLQSPTNMLIDQIIGNDVSLQSGGAINNTDTHTPSINANNLKLVANGDIGSNSTPLSVQANLISFAQSQNGDIYLQSNGDMKINSIKAPKTVSLESTDGAITQNSSGMTNIQSDKLILHAKNGIGDNGVNENYLNLVVNTLDAYNKSANDIALKNSGSLSLSDLNFDDYVLFNGGGAIKLLIDGALSQQSGTHIFANGNINIQTVGDIFASDMKSNHDITLHTTKGSILGDPAISPNLAAKEKLTLHADNGVVGSPAKTLTIRKGTGDVEVKAKAASNFLSVYIFFISSAGNFFTDQDLAVYNNRIISGSLIEKYYKSVFQNKRIPIQNLAQWLDLNIQNLGLTRFDGLINISLLN